MLPAPGAGAGAGGGFGPGGSDWDALADALLPPGRPRAPAPSGPPALRESALESARQELRAAAWERASLVLSELRGVGVTSVSGRNAFLDALVDFVGVHEGLLQRERDLELVQAGLLFELRHHAETLRLAEGLVEAAAGRREDAALVGRARAILGEGRPPGERSPL